MRVLSILVLLVFCTSCKFFSSEEKKDLHALDTIINFTKVDASPFFEACKDKIDKERTDCFRTTLHAKIAKKLAAEKLQVKDSINDVLTVKLIISSKGNVILQEIIASKTIQKQLPKLDSLLRVSISELPKMYPASKQGIPVTTQYSLPIRIQLK